MQLYHITRLAPGRQQTSHQISTAVMSFGTYRQISRDPGSRQRHKAFPRALKLPRENLRDPTYPSEGHYSKTMPILARPVRYSHTSQCHAGCHGSPPPPPATDSWAGRVGRSSGHPPGPLFRHPLTPALATWRARAQCRPANERRRPVALRSADWRDWKRPTGAISDRPLMAVGDVRAWWKQHYRQRRQDCHPDYKRQQ